MTELEHRDDGQLATPEDLADEIESGYTAYKLKLQGVDYATIAQQLGYANAAVAQVEVSRYLQMTAVALTVERRLEVLALANDRIEDLLHMQWERAKVDPVAAAFCLRAVAQLVKQNGADTLHENEGQGSTRTIIIPATPEMGTALKRFVEENS